MIRNMACERRVRVAPTTIEFPRGDFALELNAYLASRVVALFLYIQWVVVVSSKASDNDNLEVVLLPVGQWVSGALRSQMPHNETSHCDATHRASVEVVRNLFARRLISTEWNYLRNEKRFVSLLIAMLSNKL